MSERTEKVILKMKMYANKILGYINDYSFEDFSKDAKTIEAVVFNLSQIGELSNLIDKHTKELSKEIDWNSIKGLRNRIVHDYEGIKVRIIWNVISIDLAILIKHLDSLMERLKENENK